MWCVFDLRRISDQGELIQCALVARNECEEDEAAEEDEEQRTSSGEGLVNSQSMPSSLSTESHLPASSRNLLRPWLAVLLM